MRHEIFVTKPKKSADIHIISNFKYQLMYFIMKIAVKQLKAVFFNIKTVVVSYFTVRSKKYSALNSTKQGADTKNLYERNIYLL